MPQSIVFSGLFWRFLPATVPVIDYMIARDADSRYSAREQAAVDEWIESNADFHVMRDHPAHGVPMLGGMWGCRPARVAERFQAALLAWASGMAPGNHRRGAYFDQDQRFLRHAVWPWARESCVAHDDAGRYGGDVRPFPADKIDGHFVGEVYNG